MGKPLPAFALSADVSLRKPNLCYCLKRDARTSERLLKKTPPFPAGLSWEVKARKPVQEDLDISSDDDQSQTRM